MYNFDAPIPGQSLTNLPGSSPMEHPPQFVDINDALEYTWERLTTPKYTTQMLLLLKKGMPVEYLVNTMLFQGVGTGKWTVDVALLMYQTVFWQVEAVAKLKKVKYTTKNPDVKHEQFLSNFTDMLSPKEDEDAAASSTNTMFKGLM